MSRYHCYLVASILHFVASAILAHSIFERTSRSMTSQPAQYEDEWEYEYDQNDTEVCQACIDRDKRALCSVCMTAPCPCILTAR